MESSFLETLHSRTKIIGTPILFSKKDCMNAAKELGLPMLPPSYVEYMSIFGSGSLGEICIFPPVAKKSYGLVRLVRQRLFRTDRHEPFVLEEIKPEDRDLFDRVMEIARDGYECSLCWDPASQGPDGEMDLYMTTVKDYWIDKVGRNLSDFIKDFVCSNKNRIKKKHGLKNYWSYYGEFHCFK